MIYGATVPAVSEAVLGIITRKIISAPIHIMISTLIIKPRLPVLGRAKSRRVAKAQEALANIKEAPI
jgi:hypothetical protein